MHTFYKKLRNHRLFSKFRKKIALFSIVMIPVTSVGAGMTIHVDNTLNSEQKPIFANDTVINLDENIIVNFKEPVVDTEQYEDEIAVYPQTQMLFFWGNDGERLTIVPKSIWKADTEYSLAFPRSIYDNNDQLSTFFSFETEKYPEIIYTNIDKEKRLTENQDIVMQFDEAIDDFDVQVVARPSIAMKQVYDAEKKELHISLEEKSGSKSGFHTLTTFMKHRKESNARFFPLEAISFNVFLPKPETWPKQHAERLDIARKSTVPQIFNGKYIDVNLEAQVTTLFDNGEFVASFLSSAGAKDTPTPTGSFQIYNKNPYALSNMFQVYLPYWMAFTPDGKYGFHDLIVWPDGAKESEKNIGNAVSPGCVRHDAENSKFIYEWADIGTKVIIY